MGMRVAVALLANGSLAVEQLEHRLRADGAVIVLEFVGELQRSARLSPVQRKSSPIGSGVTQWS
jgi:hypothetical protein